ncbi:MAG: recombinase family protein, partial [Ktedonobacterales bacterium]
DMMLAASQRKFATVIVHHPDRLSRKHAGIIKYQLERSGANVVYVLRQYDDSPEGEAYAYMDDLVASIENRRRTERFQKGKEGRVAEGKGYPLAGNRPLFGYRPVQGDSKRLEIDPDIAPTVRRIFEEYADGSSLRSLAIHLTEEGVVTPSMHAKRENAHTYWDHGTLRWMLRQSAYWGVWVSFRTKSGRRHLGDRDADGQRFKSLRYQVPNDAPIVHTSSDKLPPPIIDRELAARVQQRLATARKFSRRNNRHPEDTLLYGGLAKCGYCGASLSVKWIQRKGQTQQHIRYVCPTGNRLPGYACVGVNIYASKLDAAVRTKLSQFLFERPAAIDGVREQVRDDIDSLADKVEAYQKRIDELVGKRRALFEQLPLLTNETAKADMRLRIDQLGEEQEELVRTRQALETILAEKRAGQHGIGVLEQQLEAYRHMFNDEVSPSWLRQQLIDLGVTVTVWKQSDPDHPRAELEIMYNTDGELVQVMPNKQFLVSSS